MSGGVTHSPSLGDAAHDRDREGFRTLHFLTLGALIQIGIFFLIAHWIPGSPTANFLILAAIPPIAFTYFIILWTRSPAISGNWGVGVGFILFFLISLHTGGLSAPALIWSVAIPFVATMIAGSRFGILWFLLMMLEFSFFFKYEWMGGKVIQEYASRDYHFFYYLSILGFTFSAFFFALISEYGRQQSLNKIEAKHRELEEAMENIRTLKGLLPVCSSCKKVRNDQGYWDRLESYAAEHAPVSFTHGICPECFAKFSRT